MPTSSSVHDQKAMDLADFGFWLEITAFEWLFHLLNTEHSVCYCFMYALCIPVYGQIQHVIQSEVCSQLDIFFENNVVDSKETAYSAVISNFIATICGFNQDHWS